jgi:hypothetical protein
MRFLSGASDWYACSVPFPILPCRIALPCQHRQQRILPQLVVIIDIFVSQHQRINALPQHLLQPVLDPRRLPSIAKTIPQSLQQSDPSVGLSQQQSPGIILLSRAKFVSCAVRSSLTADF